MWQRWVFINLDDSARLLWVVAADGLCLTQLFGGLVLGFLVPRPGFDRRVARNSKWEFAFRAFARCFRGDTKWTLNRYEIQEAAVSRQSLEAVGLGPATPGRGERTRNLESAVRPVACSGN